MCALNNVYVGGKRDIHDYIRVIDDRLNQIGMTIRALARKANMDDNMLGRSLHGKRKMTASEFIAVLHALGLTSDDFLANAEKVE